jgi:intein-encoded DNA endonuclease-like protein
MNNDIYTTRGKVFLNISVFNLYQTLYRPNSILKKVSFINFRLKMEYFNHFVKSDRILIIYSKEKCNWVS